MSRACSLKTFHLVSIIMGKFSGHHDDRPSDPSITTRRQAYWETHILVHLRTDKNEHLQILLYFTVKEINFEMPL